MHQVKWTTTGREILPGRSIPIGFSRGQPFDPEEGLSERLRFISVGKGAGLFTREMQSYPFRAPIYFCLDEKERVNLECSDPSGNLFIYFHPAILRADLDFENLRGDARMELPMDAARDAYWLNPFMQRTKPSGGIIIPSLSLARRVERLAEDLITEAEGQPTAWWPCRTRSFLIEMLFAVIAEADGTRELEALPGGEVDELVRHFFMEIGSRYAERLTVEGLARELGTNRTSLQERVLRTTGKTVAKCLSSIRLDAARILLSDTMLPVDEIADRAGYRDSSAFVRAFKRGFGTTPTEYRKAHGMVLLAE